MDGMYAVLERVDWKRGLDGEKIDIPWSKCKEIEKRHKDNPTEGRKAVYEWYLDTHPSPSWEHIAEGLFQAREHYVVQKVARQLKGIIVWCYSSYQKQCIMYI